MYQMSNLLKDRHPELIKEWDYKKNDLKLDEVTYGSPKKVWWLCDKNHSYEVSVTSRTNPSVKSACPFCSNQRVGYGNDLKSVYPKIAKEWDVKKNKLKPSQVLPGTNKKFWWVCPKKHSYEATVHSKTRDEGKNTNKGCSYCAGKKVGYGNDLKTVYPNIAKEWDVKKNNLKATEVISHSNKKYWWLCPKKHSYEVSVNKRTSGKRNCPYCSGQKVGYGNDLKSKFPKIAKEWDVKKNKLKPNDVMPGTGKKYWWLCPKKHSYETSPGGRTGKMQGCPYCSGQKVGYGNDLKSVYPKIAKEWDVKKNKLKPNEVTPSTNKKYWWLCPKKHSYEGAPSHRTRGTGCPYCVGKKIGYGNDLNSKFPKIAKEWDVKKNKLSAKEVAPTSKKKYWWICLVGHSYYSDIGHRTSEGTGCPYCTLTPRSREEVYLLFELKQFFNIDENDHKIKLKRVEDVDIKLANEKVVIEYDGAYWHKDKAERDKAKTKALEKAGWTVIRVREKPLKVLSRKYNVSSKTGEYKETANKVLKKLNQLGYEVKGLDKYLERKTLDK